MKKRKELINYSGDKHAYEVGRTTTRSPGSLDLFWVNLLTFYPPGAWSEFDPHENSIADLTAESKVTDSRSPTQNPARVESNLNSLEGRQS